MKCVKQYRHRTGWRHFDLLQLENETEAGHTFGENRHKKASVLANELKMSTARRYIDK